MLIYLAITIIMLLLTTLDCLDDDDYLEAAFFGAIMTYGLLLLLAKYAPFLTQIL